MLILTVFPDLPFRNVALFIEYSGSRACQIGDVADISSCKVWGHFLLGHPLWRFSQLSMPSIFEELVNIWFGDERRRSKIVAPLVLVTLAAHTISSGMFHQLSGPQSRPLRVAKPVESAFTCPSPAVWLAPIVSESYHFCRDEAATAVSGQAPVSRFPFLPASIFLCIQYRNIPLFQE